VAGRVELSEEQLAAAGIVAALALTDIEPDLERCRRDAGTLLERLAAERVAALI
jgi:glycerate kinase